jgi:hypothetical protein
VPPGLELAIARSIHRGAEGSLEDAEGACGPGDFVWRSGGNIHVAHAPNGATFLSVFNRPNRFFNGTKFFTAE